MNIITNRFDFTFLFDVKYGNPNGDPDSGNAPRTDAETGMGIVTATAIKHKVRKYVSDIMNGAEGFEILIGRDKCLNDKFMEARQIIGVSNNSSKVFDETTRAKRYMCARYYDVRAFGAVMSTGEEGISCGSVCGPVQLGMGLSVDPVNPMEITITRQAITSREKFERLTKRTGEPTEMGRQYVIPYALYRVDGHVSALNAERSGFTENDLNLFWDALANMFENDRASVRGELSSKRLYVFKHASRVGNAPSDMLFKKIRISRRDEVVCPREFTDYMVCVDDAMPCGVEFIEML
ncbi:MAG: type I-C CRISPR-associated protein Cas7/Csd2 [Clostridia bacterium]|nr:type I-C CRISPR-associated protein Cas7/Csd2 [Clostridia bacterium]